jgi:hypothetical protein
MPITYEKIIVPATEFSAEYTFIKRTNEDGSISGIPLDEANADYQAYLNKDKAEQSTPSLTDAQEL